MKSQLAKTEIFVNECSLHAQFQNATEFEAAIINFIALINEIKAKNNFHADFYRGNIFINFQAVKNQVFQRTFSELKQASQLRFKRLLKDDLKDWQNQKKHKINDDYVLIDTSENITNTSIAEAAERKLQQNETVFLLVNFINSNFKTSHQKYLLCQVIAVSKNQQPHIELDCLNNTAAFEQWVKDKLYQLSFLDKNPQRFTKTNKISILNTVIYIEDKTKYYWYFDNYHNTHFEVFNKLEIHLGEANLDGILDPNKADKKKNYKLFGKK